MRSIPIKNKTGGFDLFIVLSKTNLERLERYDPITYEIGKLPQPWSKLHLTEFHILFATEAEFRELDNISSIKELLLVLKKLGRGWEFRPDLGDNDKPYTEVVPGNKRN